MKINIDNCRVQHASRLAKSLGGLGDDPSTICVVQINLDASVIYQEAVDYLIKESSGLIVPQITLRPFPDATFPIKHHTDFYSIALDAQALLFVGRTETIRQMIYDPSKYQYKPIYSMAYQSGVGTIQYSQVIAPTVWVEPLHEIFHSYFAYFGLEDRVHEIIEANGRIVQQAFPKIIQELVTVWPIKDLSPFPYINVSTF